MIDTNRWIVRYQSHPKVRLRLFCFPYAGGSTSTYRKWSELLPSDIEVCPVQLPGRENRSMEAPFTHVTPLVESLLPVLNSYLDLPYAFFGHSMGALISFELARQIRKQRYPEPQHLFVSSRRSPHLPSSEPPIHKLPETAFWEQLRLYDGVPDTLLQSSQIAKFFLPLLRADFAIHETYKYTPGTQFNYPITAFGGLHDRKVGSEEIMAWRELTNSDFYLHLFPGNHLFLRKEYQQILSVIARNLSQKIAA
ncbi:thioesterase II family protein [Dendronalium sp. ChiSLP03b]|uniref:thioesterase II family protein n=1 Tax=Dendronalium sp. ChiSLP03b TaxID=3075381 RepID=UPI002AD41870|nr:thioesterase domain-containing protein [Dendronalium sp. ChiSLP03b]MDZ8204698.1 thioesterase domain-containing protein [Dendronalium sp. ChiSLP03b]